MARRKKTKKDGCPKRVGERSELHVMAKLMGNGMPILIPFGDSERYDFVVDEGGDFVRVQCKTGRVERSGTVVVFETCSTNWYSGGKKNYIGQADVFAVFVPELDEVYLFDVSGCPKTEATARLTETANKQKKGIRMAQDHLFVAGKSLRSYP